MFQVQALHSFPNIEGIVDCHLRGVSLSKHIACGAAEANATVASSINKCVTYRSCLGAELKPCELQLS